MLVTIIAWGVLALSVESSRSIFARGDCQTQSVASGDSCASLASKCKISSEDFNKFNTAQDLCSTLAPGQRVCCSAGTLPDIRPKKQADGSCASYTVVSGDNCDTIAAKNGLKRRDLSDFNDKTTWGWTGCKNLMAGVAICLSKGKPPLPAPQKNAVCGPTKPGTKAPKSFLGHILPIKDLNPCPLNACCNIWGQCGITPEFCKEEKGPTGNPGTSPKGTNGCISNCGTDVANNKDPPTSFTRVGYYESWNWDRPCLNMKTSSINDTLYTHVHWAFATISKDFGVDINDTYKQFDGFKALKTKKIISFGGWGYSTDPKTYDMLRKAMSDAHASTFADNVVKYLNDNKLDGVDFDWEYPGATDIPGTPPGSKSDGPTYLKFLKLLKSKLPAEKSLSIAAPASYWYLKNFPIGDMAKTLDYIVYMTYDLHGQWDYGNKFGQEGCKAGNCLRSHVNLTETNYVLAMITKAGVPANKINVGISNYGRSFKMDKAGCDGPMCTYKGPESAAAKGECTTTAGYISNSELYDILSDEESKPKTWYDQNSNSNIMVYNDTEWVAFMNEDTRTSRGDFYKSLNFGGTIDWAIDLGPDAADDGDLNEIPDDKDEQLWDLPDPVKCDATYKTMEELDGAAGTMEDECRTLYTLRTLAHVLENATSTYNDMLSDGYDGKFKTYSKAIADAAGKTVHDWIYKNGPTYFTCAVSEPTICCKLCKANQKRPTECDYCFDGKCNENCGLRRDLTNQFPQTYADGAMPASPLLERDRPQPASQCMRRGDQKIITEPCPPDYSKRGYGPDFPWEQSVYWSMKPDKTDQFYADLLENTGIPRNKTKIDRYNFGNACAPSAKKNDVCWGSGFDYDIPVPDHYGADDVTNPKDTVSKALDNTKTLGDQLHWAVMEVENYCFIGDPTELVDTVSLPILMISPAVDSMSQVVETAEQIDEEKRKAIILAFIGAILFFIPIAGEVLGSLTELADIATTLVVLGTAGNVAMDVYTIVDDPENAPLAIFSLIVEPLALLDIATISKAASVRRGMSDTDIAKLGGKIGDHMGTINKVIGTCKRA